MSKTIQDIMRRMDYAVKIVEELRRQSLEAHLRGDLKTADRIAALLGDKLPSDFEKENL